jgi:gamma-glutamylcyclotransferase (GGCT)/AIG2-like uncharacterized protein YtfP
MATSAKRRKKTRKAVSEKPEPTPLKRAGFRDPEFVHSVVLRMGTGFIDALDELCDINKRSRREIIEILVAEASFEYRNDHEARINPI